MTARDGLLYVSCQTGVRIYQSLPDGTLHPIDTLAVSALGGIPNKLAIDDDTLWVSLANAPIVRGVDLMRGYYDPLRTVQSVDLNGVPAIAAALLVRDGVMLIATGSQASVVVHQLRLGTDSPALAQLPLAHLTDSVPLFAGAMALQGQTLYVAGGNGDVQLFDVGPWLDLNFSAAIELANYFSVFGSADALALGRRMVYAGAAYLEYASTTFENPVERARLCAVCGGACGFCKMRPTGALNTLADGLLNVVEQVPEPRGVLPVTADVEVQLNRVLNEAQVLSNGANLFQVSLGSAPIAGTVTTRINNTGSRLIFHPAQAFAPQREYSVRIASALSDVQGQTLRSDYRFRFTTESGLMPSIDELTPDLGSWRGGAQITLRGGGLSSSTRITVGGQTVSPAQIVAVTSEEIRFLLPALPAAPAHDLLVGVAVENGALRSFRAGRLTYVADPRLDAVGQWNVATNTLEPNDDRFLFNEGEFLAIRGEGLNAGTRVLVNGKPALELSVVDERTLRLRVPDDTIGRLTLEVSNQQGVDGVQNVETVIDLPVDSSLALGGGFLRANAGDILALTSGNRVLLYSTRDGPVPVLLSSFTLEGTPSELALSDGWLIAQIASSSALVV
ncbi:MAG TPA: IPT/TIG domain-containing protein, partial [Polyangiales bacterium]|nr:IPT/TIG domain-containing protein [Polyangiales bacterium]